MKLSTSGYQTDNMDLSGGTQYFTPSNAYTFDGGARFHNRSHTLASNLVTIFNPTLTNELQANLSYVNIPINFATPEKVSYKGLNFPYQLGNGSSLVPAVINYIMATGLPSIGAADSSQYYSRKFTPTVSDTITKVAGTHTLKAGVKYMHVTNEQLSYNPVNSNNGSINYFAMYQNGLVNFFTDNVPANGYSTTSTTPIDTGFNQFGFFVEDDWKVAKRLTLTLGVRFDHFGAWTDQSGNGKGLAVFSKTYLDKDVAAGVTSLPGVRTHAMDSSIPKSGRDTKPLYVAPRFGLAYDVFGNSKTVLRGGIGAYYYNDSYEGYSQALALGNGSVYCSNKNAATLAQIAAGSAAAAVSCSDSNSSVTSITAADPTDDHEPLTWTYNFSVSQRSFKNSILEVAYSGSQTSNLMNPLQNINYIPMGAFYKNGATLDAVRNLINAHNADSSVYNPYRVLTDKYQAINLIRHGAWSTYNALQVSWNRPMGSFSYGFNYTWSKTMGITGSADPANIHNDYGPSAQDRTQVFNATYTYDVGDRFKSHKGLNLVLANWSQRYHGHPEWSAVPVGIGDQLRAGWDDVNLQHRLVGPNAKELRQRQQRAVAGNRELHANAGADLQDPEGRRHRRTVLQSLLLQVA
jgi:hypothetical protein